jgi:hypothetical protein
MDEGTQRRRRIAAALIVVGPVAIGLVIAALAHFAGGGEEADVTKTEAGQQRQGHELVEAASSAAAGSPAPRVRLTEGGTGKAFDSAALGSEPYAVVFLTVRCDPLGDYLRQVDAELGPGKGAVLAISADPKLDSPGAARAWLAKHRLAPGGAVHFLIGEEGELRGLWNAWGFDGPVAECGESVPVHLVSGKGTNEGILDVSPSAPPSLLTDPLGGLAK